ncbi:hypothetical protein BJF93_04180 [Xaviernesmea oryzae]|uniref:Uncharacterized protein n=1 Tax=Xaviernesmea oryzae TaxID=464029 RepID=A0A1Q9AUL5_9HYPH|nr:hypothetical protein [Xaviernesmea oryzae]OLP59123.1 hypothetical protein BJF93_04180 [Xaviernesmea oryzae]SEK85643.1 hypothetical protein SAMN04487976_104206 [Xaviernesmea oryzae]
MTFLSSPITTPNADGGDLDIEELRALARMLTYARQSAADLHLETAASCIEMALRSVLQETSGMIEGLSAHTISAALKIRAH